jgi:hypothetical protein
VRSGGSGNLLAHLLFHGDKIHRDQRTGPEGGPQPSATQHRHAAAAGSTARQSPAAVSTARQLPAAVTPRQAPGRVFMV